MDTAALLRLRARLLAWESAALGDPLAAYRHGQLDRYLAQLRELTEGERHIPERAATMVALALGPRDALPGAGDLGSLVRAAIEREPDVVDLGVAWGCGWQRVVTPEHRWHGRWVPAILCLSAMVAGSINQTVRWLRAGVPDFRAALRALGETELQERCQGFDHEIAMELAIGVCRCGHGDRAHGSSIGACARPEHRLASWTPDVCRLAAFVAEAVRGSAQPAPKSGAFATSMLAPRLLEEQLVRVDLAEFRVCHRCNDELIRFAVERQRPIALSSVERGLYDVSRCPSCGTAPTTGRTYYAGRKHWLLVPAAWGGQYHSIQRYRCGACGNLFGRWCDRCPLCRWRVRHRDRRTLVWVRHANLRQDV